MTGNWMDRLERIRKGKDRFFRESPQSPLSRRDRETFEGLDYYPVNEEYRFEIELHEHEDKAAVTLDATGGDKRHMVRWGEFRFVVDGSERKLSAYQVDPGEGRLFVPFRDATADTDTYPRGRYLDLDPRVHQTPEGRWVLDFNEAYNPWCAYTDGYSCVIPPGENSLDLSIRAGEKRYRYPDSH
ncbi:MAG: DUF1684 domain-containing protein [Gemmatimonadetes bacterium]|nr:DUF1684 domain-containing protein [Gemmatimonadota bacterium]